ncbi:phosphotransferase enzyme family protein [Saccharibacillus alkalitolerans]|uniref:Phosphotransferase n=1 Tax=Saccharibacillus alkalitolerans TaxID=2705290 RepID=A0ABX0F9A0_9BACL|nr:phosphotransferase [Saccharibacillus alkalitolerans]NGZ76554.1 phosphotransferase [Saccharibacillus alkalitolerans]
MSALKSKNVALSEPAANRTGVFITDAASNGKQHFYATLLKWTEGDFLGRGEHTEESLRKMGAMMANIHEASLDFSPSAGFSRPTWGIPSFQRDWEHLRAHRRSFISDRDFELYVSAFAKAIAHIETFSIDKQNYGIIHADLHIGNIVFQQNEPYPIDFGRCGFGYHLYDIAQAIMGLQPPQRTFFIEGYNKVRQLEDDAFSKIESFLIIAIIESYSFYAESGADTEMLIEDQPFAQAILKAYLKGTPFLFEQPELS